MSFDDALFSLICRFAPIFLRLALGMTFLTAVADRFGGWGHFGTPNVAWGDFAPFYSVHGAAEPVGTSRSSPGASVVGHGRRDRAWRDAYCRAVY
jgi:hypothetical protein